MREKLLCAWEQSPIFVWTSGDKVDDINSQNLSLHAVELRQFFLFEFIFLTAVCLTILSDNGMTELLLQLFLWAVGF